MQVEIENRPRRPNSKVARVYPYLVAGASRQVIAETTGLAGNQLTEAIRKNYQLGYVPRPTVEEQIRMHRLNTSAGKGGILLVIEKYFPLDLTARQTKVALEVYDGIELTREQIVAAYSREVHRHGLQRPLEELMVEAQRDKRRSKEELLNIVVRRQAAHRVMLTSGLEKPKTLQQWRELEHEPPTEEEINRLAELLLNPIFVPRSPLEQRYLLNINNYSPHLNEALEAIDPTLKKRLEVRASLIRRQSRRVLR